MEEPTRLVLGDGHILSVIKFKSGYSIGLFEPNMGNSLWFKDCLTLAQAVHIYAVEELLHR
jgi:hypothetical protein